MCFGVRVKCIGVHIFTVRRTQFYLMSRPIVSSDGHVVFKLRQLKNVQIKLANHILSKIAYIFKHNKLLPRFSQKNISRVGGSNCGEMQVLKKIKHILKY